VKVIVYTALIGDIDQLWSVMPGSDDVQHVAFVDTPKLEAGLWGGSPPTILPKTSGKKARPTWDKQTVKPEWGTRRTARHYKTLPHRYLPDADVWIWIDSNVRLRMHPLTLIKRYLKDNDLVAFKHWDRDCLYTEAAFCAKHGKDKRDILEAQMARYLKDGMPKRWGLAATRVVIRRNTPAVRELDESWWDEIERGSVRDQVSFPYVCWKHKMTWGVLPGRCCPRNTGKEYICIPHTRQAGKKK